MRKLQANTEVVAPPGAIRSRPALVAWVALGLLLTPLAIDGAKVVLSRWQSMFGPAVTVDTPTLDFARGLTGEIRQTVVRALRRCTHRLPWPVDYAAAGLVLCAVAGTYFLKRGRWS